MSLNELADRTRLTLLGWIQYYGRYYRSALAQVLRWVDAALVRWAQRKYKHLHGRKVCAAAWLKDVKSRQPRLFAHWAMSPRLDDRSRMNREVHVRICEGVRVRFPCATRLLAVSV